MHEAAAKHVTPWQPKLDLNSLNRCGMVGVCLEACQEGGNQIWSEKKKY
jgi:hypothetical protein